MCEKLRSFMSTLNPNEIRVVLSQDNISYERKCHNGRYVISFEWTKIPSYLNQSYWTKSCVYFRFQSSKDSEPYLNALLLFVKDERHVYLLETGDFSKLPISQNNKWNTRGSITYKSSFSLYRRPFDDSRDLRALVPSEKLEINLNSMYYKIPEFSLMDKFDQYTPYVEQNYFGLIDLLYCVGCTMVEIVSDRIIIKERVNGSEAFFNTLTLLKGSVFEVYGNGAGNIFIRDLRYTLSDVNVGIVVDVTTGKRCLSKMPEPSTSKASYYNEGTVLRQKTINSVYRRYLDLKKNFYPRQEYKKYNVDIVRFLDTKWNLLISLNKEMELKSLYPVDVNMLKGRDNTVSVMYASDNHRNFFLIRFTDRHLLETSVYSQRNDILEVNTNLEYFDVYSLVATKEYIKTLTELREEVLLKETIQQLE